ncbi:P68 family surface lipoprotein [Mycoplasma sp. 5912]
MTRKYKLLSVLFGTSSLTTLIAASCGTSQQKKTPGTGTETAQYPTDKAASDNTVRLATAQGKVYPLMIALKQLVPLYNQTMKDQAGYLPVVLETADETKAKSEYELGTQAENYIRTNDAKLANLLLGNKTTAYQINSYGKILDVSDTLPNNLFPTKILKNHNNLVGEDTSGGKIYNLPFDVSDTNGFSINIDLLNKALELMKTAGATVVSEGKVFEKLTANKDKGNNIPAESVINYLKAKPGSLTGYIVNQKTFEGVESLFEFARKFYSAVEVDTAKVATATTELIPLQAFSIDYQQDEFYKLINNDLNYKKLWELEPTTNNQFDLSKIKYNLPSDQAMKDKFVEVFNKFVDNHSIQVQTKVGDKDVPKPILFRDVKFENNSNEWASWHMRQYQTIFAIVASVGLEQSVNSQTSRNFFAAKNPDAPKKWTTRDDVFLQQQITKNKADDTNATYFEGGSSLIPVAVGSKEDAATKMFLNWLYNGKTTWNNKEVNVRDLMSELSAYIIPLNTDLTRGVSFYNNVESDLDTQIAANETKLKTLSDGEEKTNLQKATEALKSQANYTHSAALSFTSLKEFNDGNEDLFSLPSNPKTTKINAYIATQLLNSTLDKNATKANGTDVLNHVLDLISKEN